MDVNKDSRRHLLPKLAIEGFKNHAKIVKHITHTVRTFNFELNNDLEDIFFRTTNKATVVRSTGKNLGEVLPSM